MECEKMTQEERLDYLIGWLFRESFPYQERSVKKEDKRALLRALLNVRMPKPVSREFLEVQDAFLSREAFEKGIVLLEQIPTIGEAYGYTGPFSDRISIWQGDITRLGVDAVVNAANSQLLGCFVPCHGCIDNAIHSAAGVMLREECARLMEEQGHKEPTGRAKLTKGYNLPSRFVLHTVGPVILGKVSQEDVRLLASCYESCLRLAEAHQLESIAFCCISTGEFHFPNALAAETAVETVRKYLAHSQISRVIFNVFQDQDREIYERVLKQ